MTAESSEICSATIIAALLEEIRQTRRCQAQGDSLFCVRGISYQNIFGVFRFDLQVAESHERLRDLNRMASATRRRTLENLARDAAGWMGLLVGDRANSIGILAQVRELDGQCSMRATVEKLRTLSFASVAVPYRGDLVEFAVYADGKVRALQGLDLD